MHVSRILPYNWCGFVEKERPIDKFRWQIPLLLNAMLDEVCSILKLSLHALPFIRIPTSNNVERTARLRLRSLKRHLNNSKHRCDESDVFFVRP